MYHHFLHKYKHLHTYVKFVYTKTTRVNFWKGDSHASGVPSFVLNLLFFERSPTTTHLLSVNFFIPSFFFFQYIWMYIYILFYMPRGNWFINALWRSPDRITSDVRAWHVSFYTYTHICILLPSYRWTCMRNWSLKD